MSALPDEVRRAYSLGDEVTPLTSGLINQTYLVTTTTGERVVVQRVNDIFGAAVHEDIDAITERLAERGVPVPRLVPTRERKTHLVTSEGVYRALTFIEGQTRSTLGDTVAACSAGALVGRMHRALHGFTHTFAFTRPGPHETPKHLRHLQATMASHADHARAEQIRPLAERILDVSRQLPVLPVLPARVIHGDLKVTNLLFRGSEATAILDLDTFQHGTIATEMGDAMRSWCNPAGEERPGAVDVGLFTAAMQGYLRHAGDVLTAAEVESIPVGLETISLELSARFCADAYTESYFGWDADRYASRSHHNEMRARSQLALSLDVRAQRDALSEALAAAV